MNVCPICGKDMTWHTDQDCITPLHNRIKQLERIAELSAQQEFHPVSLQVHRELAAALRAAGYGD